MKIKLIPIKNPNFKIKNSTEDLINLLKYVPIITVEDNDEIIIGFIDSKSDFYYDENFVYGDIYYYKDKYNNYEFVNYMCYIDVDKSIIKFDYIQFKKGEQ